MVIYFRDVYCFFLDISLHRILLFKRREILMDTHLRVIMSDSLYLVSGLLEEFRIFPRFRRCGPSEEGAFFLWGRAGESPPHHQEGCAETQRASPRGLFCLMKVERLLVRLHRILMLQLN